MPAPLDIALLRIFRTRAHAPTRDRVVLRLTRLGEHGGLWFALAGAGAAADRNRRAGYGRAASTVAVAYGLNQLIKLAVGRRRPELPGLPPLVATGSGISYPSAHAATSFAAAQALGRLWPAPPLHAAAVAMALSRLYVGVHYPSDVIAGAALGSAVAVLLA